MAFVVLYDACVRYPAPLRDLLVRVANVGLVRACWSDAILDECFRSILEQRPDLRADALERTRESMKRAVPDCMVTGFESLIGGLDLPDVTIDTCSPPPSARAHRRSSRSNVDDFPNDRLQPYGIDAKHPDDFVLDLIELAPGLVGHVVAEQAAALESPPRTVGEVLDTLRDQGLVRSVARLREVLGSG